MKVYFDTPTSEPRLVYEEGPITYLLAGALHAHREGQSRIRDWYLRRVVEYVALDAGSALGMEGTEAR